MADISSSSWNKLHDRYYRKREIYTMQWQDVDLAKMVVVGAPFGGPIAMIRNESIIVKVGVSGLKPTLFIYSSSGALLGKTLWNYGRLVKMGWNDAQQLVCVIEDGTVVIFTMFAEQLRKHSCGNRESIRDCVIWANGLVALTDKNILISVEDFANFAPHLMADLPFSARPTCMAVIQPEFTASGEPEVLIAVENTIFTVTSTSARDHGVANGPFSKMAVAPNGKLLATFTADGNVWVSATDFSKALSDFATKSKVPPLQLVWCGTDSVVLYWDKILFMVGPYGDWVKYSYDDPLVLIPEMDAVRLVSNDMCELLQRVADCTVDIFKIGSCTAGAMLYEAMEAFAKHDPKADEYMRSIKNDLNKAVDICVEAAAYEFNEEVQHNLLKAASYGKCFCEYYNADNFVNMCKTVRVLNALHDPAIGIPMTMQQYKRLTPEVVVSRLVQCKHHLLALRIADFLELDKSGILIHWACEKIKNSRDIDENALHDIVKEKLNMCSGVSFRQVSATAFEQKRPRLAKKLLDNEPRAFDQVTMLIEMDDPSLALTKAVNSGDTDLIYLALFHLMKTSTSLHNLFEIAMRVPAARDLLMIYYRNTDPEMERTFYEIEDEQKLALYIYKSSFIHPRLQDRLRLIENAKRHFQETPNKDNREFYTKACEEHTRLLQYQEELDSSRSSSTTYTNMSLNETLFNLFLNNEGAKAQKLRAAFKISDKRWWWVKIKGLAASHNWEELDKFCKEKKPPTGYEPFAEACIEQKVPLEALKYIPKVADHSRRAEYYLRLGRFVEAAKSAIEGKDSDILQTIRTSCKDPTISALIEQLVASSGL